MAKNRGPGPEPPSVEELRERFERKVLEGQELRSNQQSVKEQKMWRRVACIVGKILTAAWKRKKNDRTAP